MSCSRKLRTTVGQPVGPNEVHGAERPERRMERSVDPSRFRSLRGIVLWRWKQLDGRDAGGGDRRALVIVISRVVNFTDSPNSR